MEADTQNGNPGLDLFGRKRAMANSQSGSSRQESPESNAPPDKAAAQPEQTAVDQRDQLIQELHDAISSRDNFLAIATHELRNPLTPIVLSLRFLRAAEVSNDRTRVMQEIDRLERQIKRFLAPLISSRSCADWGR
jgi:signal transduction histidine kinase